MKERPHDPRPGSGLSLELFSAEQDPPPAGAEEGQMGEVDPPAAKERRIESVSIAAFAKRQADLYQAGVESASAYWAARGITWPRK